MIETFTAAPELITEHWLNTPKSISLKELRGKIVVIEAFQMLCPGCVSHGIPQTRRIIDTFSAEDVAVLGLHTVFEHHEVQGQHAALAAFVHEYAITFPVGVDAPSSNNPLPQSMINYSLRGTPSLILIDRRGQYRTQHFGMISDLELGASIMKLVLDR